MDQGILVAVEEAFHFGFPLDAEAVLIIEVDGLEAGLDAQRDRVVEFCREQGAREVRFAKDAKERLQLWKAASRPSARSAGSAPATARKTASCRAPSCRTSCARIREIGQKYDIRIVNVFHAGDGNMHPILLFDERRSGRSGARARRQREILNECIACGGSVTGEHGIGVEKINFMTRLFSEDDVDVMKRLRDALNPRGLLTPGKMLPTAGACGMEQIHPGRRAAL